MRLALVLLAFVAVVGTAAACEGLSPGDQMTTDAGLCTLAFILADADDLYFATAGHCIQVDQAAATPDHGEIGVGAFHFLEPETGSTSDGSPGMDFGLIRIHEGQYPNLNPKVCGWDGPLGVYEGGAEGGGVRHYGHGMVFGDLGPTGQKREGAFLFTDEQAFYWTGLAVMGDSGSAVLDENGLALGVFTHVLAGVNGVPPADNGGTRLQRGLALAAEEGFTDLRLVLAGEDPVAVMREMAAKPATPEDVPADAPATGTTNVTRPANQTGRDAPASNATSSDENDSTLAPAATTDDPVTDGPDDGGNPVPAGGPALLALALALALALVRRVRL